MYHLKALCLRRNQKIMVRIAFVILFLTMDLFSYIYYFFTDIVFGENMQLMPINRYSTIYINSDEALANINVTVIGMLISWSQIFRLFFYI